MMASLSHDDVRHIAKLARLQLSEADVEKFSTELTSILQYVEQLQEVDTSSVESLAQVTGIEHSLREDTVDAGSVSPEKLLECSPLPIIDRQIQTPSAHG